MEKLKSSIERG